MWLKVETELGQCLIAEKTIKLELFQQITELCQITVHKDQFHHLIFSSKILIPQTSEMSW
jgi:hypothetical protein